MAKKIQPFHIDTVQTVPHADAGVTLYVRGWKSVKDFDKSKLQLEANGKMYPVSVGSSKRLDVVKSYPSENLPENCGLTVKLVLDEPVKTLKLFYDGQEEVEFTDEMLQGGMFEQGLLYSKDKSWFENERLFLSGWILSPQPGEFEFYIKDSQGSLAPQSKISEMKRMDVEDTYLTEKEAVVGFNLQIKNPQDQEFVLEVRQNDSVWSIPFSRVEEVTPSRWNLSPDRIRRGLRYLKENGLSSFLNKAIKNEEKLNPATDSMNLPNYNEWFLYHRIKPEQVKAQREQKLEKNPKFSLIVAAYNPPIEYFEEMVRSVQEQSYDNWELLIADGSTNEDVMKWLNSHPDEKIKFVKLEKNLGIADNMNAAAAMATGDYICLYDHDDFLEPDALYEMAKAVNEKEYGFIYTDEDRYFQETGIFEGPNFKPDFSFDLLRSCNYITHFLAVRKDLWDELGGLDHEYDGAQDHDLVLRLGEIVPEENIKHIPKILYHWRMHSNSTAMNVDSKPWAYQAGARAVQAALEREGLKGEVCTTQYHGWFHVKYDLEGEPKVSLLIPSKDHIDDLDKCIRSFEERSSYKNFEMIVIENNSVKDETFEYYDKIQKEFDNVKVVYWPNEFNFSAITNFGAAHADGDYLVFLNNDTELITPDLLPEMIGFAQRKDVGAVGAELFFPDDTIQHSGVVLGMGGVASHVFSGLEHDSFYYWKVLARNVSAVTGACLMTRRDVFDEVDGLNENLAVAFNDIDYCLKLREKGYHLVQTPYAQMYHYESKSRGYEVSDAKLERFYNEELTLIDRWRDDLYNPDPYFNENFSLNTTNLLLKSDVEDHPVAVQEENARKGLAKIKAKQS